MMNKTPKLEIRKMKGSTIFGFHMETTDESLHSDIPQLSARYHSTLDAKPGTAIPLYVLKKDNDPQSKKSTLFIGGKEDEEDLEPETMPDGVYACMEIRPKYGFLWAPAIADAKNWFYTQWLPGSKYTSRNLEIELHSQRTLERRPVLDLYFALTEKEN